MIPREMLELLAASFRERGLRTAWLDAYRRSDVGFCGPTGIVHVAHAHVMHADHGIARLAVDADPVRISRTARRWLGLPENKPTRWDPRADIHHPDYSRRGEFSFLLSETHRVIPWIVRWIVERDLGRPVPQWKYRWTQDASRALLEVAS
jgi:hypothetical protein